MNFIVEHCPKGFLKDDTLMTKVIEAGWGYPIQLVTVAYIYLALIV